MAGAYVQIREGMRHNYAGGGSSLAPGGTVTLTVQDEVIGE
jgi:hypothetical protein